MNETELPIYDGCTVIGFAYGWENLRRASLFVRALGDDTDDDEDEADLAERAREDTAARLSQGETAGA